MVTFLQRDKKHQTHHNPLLPRSGAPRFLAISYTLLTELQLLSAMQVIQKTHDSGGGQLTNL